LFVKIEYPSYITVMVYPLGQIGMRSESIRQ